MPFIDSIAQADAGIAYWPAALILIAVVVAAVAALALWLGLAIGRRSGRLEAERSGRDAEAAAREDAVRRSRAVLTGQIGEQLAPYLPGFPCDPADARFIGKPIDFVAFPGASAGAPVEALFIEVKTGDSRLSAAERSLKEAVVAGRVRWVDEQRAAPPVRLRYGSRAAAAADTRAGPGGGAPEPAVPAKAHRRPRT